MILFWFNNNLTEKQYNFWNLYIKDQEGELLFDSKIKNLDKYKWIIKINNETYPIKSFYSLKKYLENKNSSIIIKNNNKNVDNFAIIHKNDFNKINNLSNIESFINFEDKENILYTSYKIIGKKQLEEFYREITDENLNNFYKNNYYFIKRIDDSTTYKNKKFIDYLSKVTNSFNGINRIDKIFIINLAHRTDRMESITRELNKIGTNIDKIQKINAIYYKDFGAIGCGMSHQIALFHAEKNNYENCLILEDDFILNVDADIFNENIDKLYDITKTWDIVMLGANIEKAIESEYPFLLKIEKARTTSAYIINKNMVKIIKDNFKEACELMKKCLEENKKGNKIDENIIKHNFAIDMYWSKLQPLYKWYYFKDKISIQLPSYSDVENKFLEYGV